MEIETSLSEPITFYLTVFPTFGGALWIFTVMITDVHSLITLPYVAFLLEAYW